MTFLDAQQELAWRKLTEPLRITDDESRAALADLARRYSESSRFYHTLEHVARMLDTVEEWGPKVGLADPNAVRLAVWFHDAVYDTHAQDNEEQSARLARAVLAHWGASAGLKTTVERLILATKTHERSGDDRDRALLLDADLAILGSVPDDYARYSQSIRQEYAWVPETDYRAGRCRVLSGFLERPQIYRTPPLSNLWESRARANLSAEIERLRP